MIVELLKERYSCRHFADTPVPQNVLDDILEAGRLSPSGGNEQPWRFGVMTDRMQIGKIAQAAYGQAWITSAAFLIVLCCTIVSDERGGRDIQIKRFPRWAGDIETMNKELYSCMNMEEHQTKIAGTHMALQALEYGIYSTWISMFDVFKVSEILGLPDGCLPSEIIAFGYPGEMNGPRRKKAQAELVFYNHYVKGE